MVLTGLTGTALQAQTESPVPALEVNNAAMYQRSFIAVKSDGAYPYKAFEWPGLYEISNHSEKPVSITDVRVVWAQAFFGERRIGLILPSKPDKAGIFQDQNAIMTALRQHQEPSAQKFPISIPSHATWYLEIPFLFELSDGHKSLSFQDESEANQWLSRALGWQPGQDGKFHCLSENVSIEVSTADGQTLKYQPLTSLLVPGCVLNMPPVAKSFTSNDWKKYSFPEDGIEFSSPAAPSKQDQHNRFVDLGSSFVIFTVEQLPQNVQNLPAKTLLDAAKGNFLRGRKYALVSSAEASLDGNSGVDFAATNEKYRCRVRIFLVKGKLISSEIVASVTAPLSVDADKVLDSLRLIPVAETKSN